MNLDDGRAFSLKLHTVAEQSRPSRLPDDLWARGLRRHRVRVAARAAAVAVVAASLVIPLATATRYRPVAPADSRPAIPSSVHGPLPLQAPAVSAPPGPAAVLVTAPDGFGGDGLFADYDDQAIVVGTNGSYRLVRHLNGFDAGESVLLSPDGRYVAGDWALESSWTRELGTAATTVVDLTTGRVRRYRAGMPIAWLPDGKRLLTSTGKLHVLEIDSGAIVDLGVAHAPTNGASVAVSPDGRRVALQVDQAIRILDLDTGEVRTLVALGGSRTLAGPGAWTADDRVAVWRCTPSCEGPTSVALELAYLDIERGTEVEGPAFKATGIVGARLLGWQRTGDAIVVRYVDTGAVWRSAPPTLGREDVTAPPTGHPELAALHPSGGSTVLLTVPDDANRIDVPRGLLDRFGASPPGPATRFLDWLSPLAGRLALLVAAGAAAYAVHLAWRRRRTGFWRTLPFHAGERRRPSPR